MGVFKKIAGLFGQEARAEKQSDIQFNSVKEISVAGVSKIIFQCNPEKGVREVAVLGRGVNNIDQKLTPQLLDNISVRLENEVGFFNLDHTGVFPNFASGLREKISLEDGVMDAYKLHVDSIIEEEIHAFVAVQKAQGNSLEYDGRMGPVAESTPAFDPNPYAPPS